MKQRRCIGVTIKQGNLKRQNYLWQKGSEERWVPLFKRNTQEIIEVFIYEL